MLLRSRRRVRRVDGQPKAEHYAQDESQQAPETAGHAWQGSKGARHAFDQDQSYNQPYSFTRRNLSAFETTETELMAMAAPAKIGESRMPNTGYSTPAATGTPSAL